MAKSVYGIVTNQHILHQTINSLKKENFKLSDISILMKPQNNLNNYSTEEPLAGLIGTGVFTIPGFGSFLAAGPIMATIAGASLSEKTEGVSGGLIGLGIPEGEAKRYIGYIEDGGLLISVRVENNHWEEKALSILKDHQASNIATANFQKVFDDVSEYHLNIDQDFDEPRSTPHG